MFDESDEEIHISSESIKHLIFREEPEEIVFPRYKSKFSKQVREEVKRNKLCHQTMGLPSDFYITYPCQSLKKRHHVIRRPDIPKCDPPHQVNGSVVPKHDDWKKETRPDKSDKNYIKHNIVKIANAVPKTGHSRYYDQATNQRYHDCIKTAPKFVYSKIFGKVPKYIKEMKRAEKHRIEEKKKENELVRKEESKLREVTQEERSQLLEGLKRRWAELQKDFQLLPMLSDTPPQIKRKLKLEKELTALEREIDHIERNQLIFVYEVPQRECPIKH